jgi:predicted dehydrogenase
MSDVLRFLISGPGLIGKQHARLVSARADSELSAIVAPPTEENRSFASEMNAKFYPSLDDALHSEELDAAIISSPNLYHFEQASICVKNNIPVLVEKPVTDDIADAGTLAKMAEEADVPVLVGHHRTYSPLLAAASSFMNSSRFGRLVAVQGAALFYKPSHYFDEGPWRTKKGGGPILINLIHEIGLLRFFCGEIERLTAVASNRIRQFEVEDTVSITFGFVNGAIGNFLLSDVAASNKSWEMTSGENPAYPHDPNGNCYHFAGTNGSLDFPSMQARFYTEAGPRSWWHNFEFDHLSFARSNPLELQLQHFTDVIRGQSRPLVSAQDGYKNMLVVQAIKQSIESGSVVNLVDR